MDFGPLTRYFMTLTAASVAGGLAGWLLNRFLVQPLGHSIWIRLASVVVGGGAGLAIFYGLCLLLGIAEARDYLKRFVSR
jgi:membrane protein YqaA with SNARE-associated domain